MNWCFNIGLFGLALYTALQFVIQPFFDESNGVVTFSVLSVTLIFMFVYCLYYSTKGYRITKLFPFTRFWLLVLLLYLVYYTAGFVGFPTDLAYQSPRELVVAIFLFVTLVFAYYGVLTGSLTSKRLMALAILFFLAGLSEIYFSTVDPRVRPGGVLEINTSHGYIFAMILPIFLYKFRQQAVWLLALSILLTMMMGKRGGLAVMLLIFVYLLANNRVFYRNYRLSFKEVALVGGTVLASLLFLQYSLDSFLYRMDNIQHEKTGQFASGRDILWSQFLDAWYRSDILNFFLGHGYYSTISYNDFVAHNDYIQILFDYGVIGLGVYLSMLAMMYLNIRKTKRDDHLLFVCLMLCFLVLVFRGMISGTVRTDQFMLCISMGYFLGVAVKKKVNCYAQ